MQPTVVLQIQNKTASTLFFISNSYVMSLYMFKNDIPGIVCRRTVSMKCTLSYIYDFNLYFILSIENSLETFKE